MILPDEVSPSLVFGIADLHDGPRVDLPSLFSHLQQETVIMGVKGERSPYPFVQKMKGVSVHLPLSETLKTHDDHHHKYTDSDFSENREFYQSDEIVQKIDCCQALVDITQKTILSTQ